MTLTTGMSMAGKMSTGMVTIETTPRTATSSASTTNVYGRRKARRTIHIGQRVLLVMSAPLRERRRRAHRPFTFFPQESDSGPTAAAFRIVSMVEVGGDVTAAPRRWPLVGGGALEPPQHLFTVGIRHQ